MTARRIISAASVAILEAHSATGVVAGVQALEDGRFAVELDDDVAAALDDIDSDTDAAIATVRFGRGILH